MELVTLEMDQSGKWVTLRERRGGGGELLIGEMDRGLRTMPPNIKVFLRRL